MQRSKHNALKVDDCIQVMDLTILLNRDKSGSKNKKCDILDMSLNLELVHATS